MNFVTANPVSTDAPTFAAILADLRTRTGTDFPATAARRCVLAHELRNPMAPITNSIFILRNAVAGSEAAKRAQAVIERQAAHLVRLIDDLLDVTRITEGKIRIERAPLDLGEVTRT